MSTPRRIQELHDEGRRLWRAGRLEEAERAYRATVDEAREAADALPDAERAVIGAEHTETRYYASVVAKLRRKLGEG